MLIKLKKQRRRLIIRISAILLSVWLIISAVYFCVRLNVEKDSIQRNVSITMLLIEQTIDSNSGKGISEYALNNFLLYNVDTLDENGDYHKNTNRQISLTDLNSGKIVTDTNGKLSVEFGLKIGKENSSVDFGFIDYNTFIKTIDEKQLNKIIKYLNTERNDEKYYELVCTKFYCYGAFVPKEVQIVLTEEDNVWYAQDEPVETFELNTDKVLASLGKKTTSLTNLIQCSDMRRNVIPKEFLLGDYNNDIFSDLNKKTLQNDFEAVKTGWFDYIFYDCRLINYNPEYSDDNSIKDVKPYYLQYADKVNILESCMSDLLFGIILTFLFVLIIATVLYVLMWKMIKSQMLQEQKRIELTNALAHDIKTPLFVISGYAQSLKENINNDKKEHFVDRIVFKTEEANETIHKMLNLSKLESCNLKMNFVELNIYELISEILVDYVNLPEGKRISFSHSGYNIITADKALIKEALENLIDNAIKYSTPNSVIEVKIEGKRFIVSNACDDLTKSDIKDIMSPYVRKDKSRHQNGNGLGLAIVKSVLDLHGTKYEIKLRNKRFIFQIEFQ